MATFLIIEPDRILAEIYAKSLKLRDHETVAVSNAQQAILAADIKKPDVVILELQLVEHSGIEFLYEFRSYLDWQQIPIIVHTTIPPSEFNDSAALLRNELGVRNYLYKPNTSLKMLRDAISEQLMVST